MDPTELIEVHQKRVDEMNGELVELPDNHNAHQLLQALYRCKALPFRERARYAVASLPYETPKLAVTGSVQEYKGWVEQMDRAIEESRKVIEARKVNGEWSAGEPVDRADRPQSLTRAQIGKPWPNRRI
jgi:hypothetical protein